MSAPGSDEADVHERLDRMEQRIDRLEQAIRQLAEHQRSEPSADDEEDEARTFSPTEDPSASPAGPEPSPAGNRSAGLEQRIGADLLAKAGVLVLVLGLAFFVAWAIESGLIGLKTRIVLGVLGGLGVAGAAYPFHDSARYGRLAQVLAGGGFGLAYFSLFAAHHFPDYQAAIGIGFWTDTILLTIVAAAAAGYGLEIASPAFLLEALALGVTTSFLALDLTAFTLAYATALGLGVALAAARLRAPRVMALSLTTIYGHGLVTHLAGESPRLVLGALAVDAALVGLFALLVPEDLSIEQGPDLADPAVLYAANAAALIAVGTLVAETGDVLADGVFPLLAGVALGLAGLPARLRSPRLTAVSLIAGLASLLTGAWFALTPVTVLYAWAGTLLALALLAGLVDHELLDRVLHAMGILVVLGTWNGFPAIEAGGERVAVLGLLTLAFAATFTVLKATRAITTQPDRRAAGLHLFAATAALGVLLLVELDAWRSTVALGGAGILALLAGFLVDWAEPRWAGLGLFGLGLLKAFAVDVWDLDPALRVVAFVGLGLALVAGAFAYARFLDPSPPDGPEGSA
jgi:uncharacterized membrane protein